MRTSNFILYLSISLFMVACSGPKKEDPSPKTTKFIEKKVQLNTQDSALHQGSTHLSVYSSIYSQTEHRTHNLTATVSMRNINISDSLYITKAVYHDTKGEPIYTYFDYPVGLSPMETLEIVINQKDGKGGTGGNFVFEWYTAANAPHFEAVMISTSGQQGISFRTEGINIE